MKDIVVVPALVLSFALFVTAHVAITYGLAFRHPRWRAIVGFFFPPIAAYWAWREHMRVRAIIVGVALALYVVATIFAHA